MATAARTLSRTALSVVRRAPTRQPQACPWSNASVSQRRLFSASPFTSRKSDDAATVTSTAREDDTVRIPPYSPDQMDAQERSMYNLMSPEDREIFDSNNRAIVEELTNPESNRELMADIDNEINLIDREEPELLPPDQFPKRDLQYWGDDEPDELGMTPEEEIDAPYAEDITSMAHAELEEHREIREYARIAAWDMPLLSKLAKPFTPPAENQVLRFRYTTYMGETHPAETKVVVEFCSEDLSPRYLTPEQRETFVKLVGPRYNPKSDIIRMSTEKFPTRAQNKRYLGDTVEALIKEAKEGDSFADVPLDLRHHTPKPFHQFPKEWAMTAQRRKQLQAAREARKLEEGRRVRLVDGNEAITEAVKRLPALSATVHIGQADSAKSRVAVRAGKAPLRAPRMR